MNNRKTVYVSAALAFLAGVCAPLLSAAPGCSNADMAGTYAMHVTGAILVAPGFPPPLIGPFARVGQISADGKGNLSVTNTASYNGYIAAESYSGTYSVAPDCGLQTDALVGLPVGPGGALVPVPFEFRGTLTNRGDNAALVLCGLAAPCSAGLPTGNVIRVQLTRDTASARACTNQSLTGAFGLDMSGTTVYGPLAGLFARDGQIVFNGSGAFTGNAIANYTGFVFQNETLSGSYSVDAKCAVSMQYSDGTLHTWTGSVTDGGNGAAVIANDTGLVVTGTLRKVKSDQR